jgi:hypothetical protein
LPSSKGKAIVNTCREIAGSETDEEAVSASVHSSRQRFAWNTSVSQHACSLLAATALDADMLTSRQGRIADAVWEKRSSPMSIWQKAAVSFRRAPMTGGTILGRPYGVKRANGRWGNRLIVDLAGDRAHHADVLGKLKPISHASKRA